MRHRLIACIACGSLSFFGCVGDARDDGPRLGRTSEAMSVESAITSGGCSSDPVTGLSNQIVEELATCVKPGFLVEVPSGGNLDNGATHKFLELPAANALKKALASRSDTLHVTSMFRTIAQQYYLYRHSSCFPAVAPPGTSNHETAIAFDASDPDNSTWRTTLSDNGFKWLGSFDRFHFDFVGSGAEDLRGQDVLAFQRLWNRNNPGDKIAEDGGFGPATEARLKASPADGFALGPDCGAKPPVTPPNAPPTGSLDEVSCETIRGWAQDPDAAGSAIDVHLYFDSVPGDAAAIVRPLRAGRDRPDLCAPLGSCNHAFERTTPLSLLDGKPHSVHAFAIDTAGGTNPEIGGSPKTVSCPRPLPPLAPTDGVRRWIPNPDVLAAWKLDTFEDLVVYDEATVAKYGNGRDWPSAPLLVKTDDAAIGIQLVDGSLHRHVQNPDSMDAWRFDWGAVKKWTADDYGKLRNAADWRQRPFLMKGDGPAVYVLDDRTDDPSSPVGPGPGPGDDTGPSIGADGGVDPDSAPSQGATGEKSGCSAGRFGPTSSSALVLLVSLAAVLRARRRRTSLSTA